MIGTAPLRKLMAIKGLSTAALSQLTGLPEVTFSLMNNGQDINEETLDILCSLLKCQPCDIIEFTKTEIKGHWEYIEDK